MELGEVFFTSGNVNGSHTDYKHYLNNKMETLEPDKCIDFLGQELFRFETKFKSEPGDWSLQDSKNLLYLEIYVNSPDFVDKNLEIRKNIVESDFYSRFFEMTGRMLENAIDTGNGSISFIYDKMQMAYLIKMNKGSRNIPSTSQEEFNSEIKDKFSILLQKIQANETVQNILIGSTWYAWNKGEVFFLKREETNVNARNESEL